MQHEQFPLDSDNALADETQAFQVHWKKGLPYRSAVSILLTLICFIGVGIGVIGLLETYRSLRAWSDDPWMQRMYNEQLYLLWGVLIAASSLFIVAILIFPQHRERRYGLDERPIDHVLLAQIRLWRGLSIFVLLGIVGLLAMGSLSFYLSSRPTDFETVPTPAFQQEAVFPVTDSLIEFTSEPIEEE